MRFNHKQFKIFVDNEISRINKEIPVFFLSKTGIKKLQKDNNDEYMDTRHMEGVISITKRNTIKKCTMPKIYIWVRKSYDFLIFKRLYHEYGHYQCVKKGCNCINKALDNNGEHITCENHADMFALKYILKISKKLDVNVAYLVLFFTITSIQDEIKIKNSICPIHKASLMKIVNTKVYKNIIKFRNSLANKIDSSIIKHIKKKYR